MTDPLVQCGNWSQSALVDDQNCKHATKTSHSTSTDDGEMMTGWLNQKLAQRREMLRLEVEAPHMVPLHLANVVRLHFVEARSCMTGMDCDFDSKRMAALSPVATVVSEWLQLEEQELSGRL